MISKSKVPQIHFQGFDGEWEEKKLGEICKLITKGTTPLDKSSNGTINYIKVENINSSSGQINITTKITEEEHQNYLKRSQLQENDILFSIAGTLGRVTTINKGLLPANTNQALAIIRLNQGVLNYITTYLKGNAVNRYIKQNPTIGAQPNLSLGQIENIQLLLPKEDEQTKIGNYFQQLDILIEQKEKKHQKLKQFKKAMLDKMFPKNGADTPEIRFKGFSGKWEVKKLGNIATFNKGKGISKADVIDNGKKLCIRYGELYTTYNEVISTIYSRTNSNVDMIYSQDNDILMPTSDVTPRGLATASALSQSGIILGGDILIIRSEKLVNIFFSYFVTGHKNKIIKLVSGTTVFHLYAKDIENLYLHLPNKKEQQKIGNYFQKLDNQINLQQKELEKLKNIKKASLDKMFV